ncbi:MAG: sigma-70 family RNA polymerase sigma factor [Ruminococcus sp.]|nr:sigma-70 family RNA polymerase sigma factor [Ruminococcus sp.]
MTNEQLAEFIQQGGADDLKPVLWERVKHLMFKICGQYYGRYSERFAACGVEMSDLRQEMYPAFLKAIESFKPAENLAFTSYLNFHIVNACRYLLGIRTGKVNAKPLDNCTSLDIPLNIEDGSEITLAGLIEDETALQAYENALDGIEDEQTRKVLTAALERLDKPLRDVITLYYFEGLTQDTIAERAGVSRECISQRIHKALRKLRAMPDVCMLRAEQRTERRLHFDSRDNSEAYYTAQKQIHKILQRGSYLSYGQRRAIFEDCKLRAALESSPEYQALTELERIYAEHEGKRLVSL